MTELEHALYNYLKNRAKPLWRIESQYEEAVKSLVKKGLIKHTIVEGVGEYWEVKE